MNLIVPRAARHENHDAADALRLHGVWDADHRRFGDLARRREQPLDFRWPGSFAGDFQRVVRTAENEPEAVAIAHRPVALTPDARNIPPVTLEIALIVIPEAPAETDVCAAENELTDNAVGDGFTALIDNRSEEHTSELQSREKLVC